MKKCIAVLLCMAILMPCSFASAEKAKTYFSGDFSYILSDDKNAEIISYAGKAAALAIPEQLDGYPVASIGDSAFSYCSSLTGVTVPDGVTSIGDRAFYSCRNLTEITIPESVVSIGAGAFDSCKALKKIIVVYHSYAEEYCINRR